MLGEYYENMKFKGDLQLVFNEDLQQKKFDNQINFEVCNYELKNCSIIKSAKKDEIFELLEQKNMLLQKSFQPLWEMF